jgi:hypothetical protein
METEGSLSEKLEEMSPPIDTSYKGLVQRLDKYQDKETQTSTGPTTTQP